MTQRNSEERCEITELIKSQCAHCKGILTPEEEEKQFAQQVDQMIKRWTK